MAFRKNKKFIDPRYFMDEKTDVIKENDQGGTFTYHVVEDEFDGGPRVDIEGVDKTFAQMMQDLDGKEIDDDDPEAAELSGVQVRRTLISVYVLSGLICAFAGWALIGRIGSVSPTSGQLANIESITAVVIGGISLFGGRGSIMGMLFGALIVGVFTLGLRLLGADAQWTFLLIGLLIIAAVAVDQWIRKVSA